MSPPQSVQQSQLSERSTQPPVVVHRRYKRPVYGGFIITDEEALKWANRILAARGEEILTLCMWDEAVILITLDDRVKEAGGIQVNFHGLRSPERGGRYGSYIVITQCAYGYFSQKLLSGPYEERAKELLKQEGVQHSEFDTIFA